MLATRFPQKLLSAITYLLVVIALALGILWLIPANDYLIFPGSAQPVSSMITVHGHSAHAGGRGQVLDTYVNEFRATHLLYVLFGLIRSDVTVEPASDVSSGCPDQQYEEQLMAMMADSKIQAEAAALHVLGYKVRVAGKGPEVSQISCNVPAAKNLRAGDQILAINGVRTPTFKAVKEQTVRHRPGTVLRLTIRRNGRVRHVNVRTVHAGKLDNIINRGGHAMIGVIMTMPLHFPVKVHIATGDVGGPSAGLAFALGIVQQITGKDLTHGNRVAVTGTITLETVSGPHGQTTYRAIVGAIGGARQKALAAQAAGARYFLVPTANYADALSAHANLKVIPVGTLGQALHILSSLPHADIAHSSAG